MATGNTISICNRALLSLGTNSQISSLNEGSTEANACSVLFTPAFEQLARAAYWNCLRKQATLTLLAAAQGTPENPLGTTYPLPPTPWIYSYAVPNDSLQCRYIVPSLPAIGTGTISPSMVAAATWLPNQGQIPFQVAYATDVSGNPLQVILTNLSQAQLVYTVNQPNPQIWDSEFQQAMVSTLAAFLAPALTLSMQLMNMQVKLAEKYIMDARVRDGNEGSTVQDHIPDWIQARNSGDGYGRFGYGNSASCWGGYGSMCWPS